ncbi:acyltransferase [bacterium]|nr:acyltransferase [bacterium]
MKKYLNELRLCIIRMYLKMRFHGKIDLGTNFRVRKRFCCLIRNGKVTIGDNVSFNNNCSVTALNSVKIGNDTIFGEGVKIYDHNHSFHKDAGLIRTQPIKMGSVTVGNNCWIGSNVVLLKGTEIGDGCVIGAGCVISGKIPINTLVRCNQSLTYEEIK